MPVKATTDETAVTLTSPIDPFYGIRTVRRIVLDPDQPRMRIFRCVQYQVVARFIEKIEQAGVAVRHIDHKVDDLPKHLIQVQRGAYRLTNLMQDSQFLPGQIQRLLDSRDGIRAGHSFYYRLQGRAWSREALSNASWAELLLCIFERPTGAGRHEEEFKRFGRPEIPLDYE